MKASLNSFLLLLVPGVALAGAAPAATTAQMDLIHPVSVALHVAHDMHHRPHGPPPADAGQHRGPQAGVETLQLDATRNFAPADGSAAQGSHVVGTLSLQSTVGSDGPSHTLSGSVTTTDTHGTAKVTLTGVTKTRGQHCMLPSAGSATLLAADGTKHTVVFSNTCGQVSIDGANVMLPAPPHHDHDDDHGHDD